MDKINQTEDEIRQKFLKSPLEPWQFCNYDLFCRLFPPPSVSAAYLTENLNIIDLHLRYNQYIFEEMAPYKWLPSILVPLIKRFSLPSLIFPLIYVNLFDLYFKPYFIWRKSKENIINIRKEFTSKLSKKKNKARRIMLYEKMKEDLEQNKQIPHKYLKFGEWTQYTFHTTVDKVEQSAIYLTRLFQTYIFIKNISREGISNLFKELSDFKNQFSTFRKEKADCEHLFMQKLPQIRDCAHLLRFKDIKEGQKFNVTKNIENRIRRFIQIHKYHLYGEFFMSGFKMDSITHLNEHYDLLEPQKYNIDTNIADLSLFYFMVAIPKILSFIVRRK